MAADPSVSLAPGQAFRFCAIPGAWFNDSVTPKERLIECFKALCDRTAGGIAAIAEATGASEENLLQIYRGTKLPSGAPRGIGPRLQAQLGEVYAGWDSAEPSPVAPPWPFRRIKPAAWSDLDPYIKAAMEEAALNKMREIQQQEQAESQPMPAKRDGTNG